MQQRESLLSSAVLGGGGEGVNQIISFTEVTGWLKSPCLESRLGRRMTVYRGAIEVAAPLREPWPRDSKVSQQACRDGEGC